MLFIHGSLAMGGVETFILRMAKQRAAENKNTVIILLSAEHRSDSGLVMEARKYARVLFLPDITSLPRLISRYFPFHLSLLLPIRTDLGKYLKDVTHVHATCGISAYFYAHIAKHLPANVKFTIGVYHSLEFCWGTPQLPYFERKNRELFFDKVSKSSIIFFNESMVPLYEKVSGQSFQAVNLFPLGVIEPSFPDLKQISQLRESSSSLKLVSVGRLVPFKTYNLHMIDVVASLLKDGIAVVYDIYGDGPLEPEMKKKISEQGLQKHINLKGILNYDRFSEVVSSYDVFIGSGSAIIQAAGLGVSAIVGIENIVSAETYGFLAELDGFSYNEDGLYAKKPLVAVLESYSKLPIAERISLSQRHIDKAKEFSMAQCVDNFDRTPHYSLDAKSVFGRFSFFVRLCYSASLFMSSLRARLSNRSLSEQVRENNI
ncbi:glycosyltransferase [Rheinheimera aquimaris]|uniref:glycosyltransferase n=1 Tax=Rheinheimera aquimaris TaxID=412437 RepID=UPI0010650238|nr:glycosyltransferase [Rheinheimera aquimaris]MCD1599827.1 glycosyltransferase [Rheinheimera aquimaris]